MFGLSVFSVSEMIKNRNEMGFCILCPFAWEIKFYWRLNEKENVVYDTSQRLGIREKLSWQWS